MQYPNTLLPLAQMADQLLPTDCEINPTCIRDSAGHVLVSAKDPNVIDFIIAARGFINRQAANVIAMAIHNDAQQAMDRPGIDPEQLAVRLMPDLTPEQSVFIAMLGYFAQRHCGNRWTWMITHDPQPQCVVKRK